MTIYRLSWTQRGQRHCQDYEREDVAQDAAAILGTNYAVKDMAVAPLKDGEPYDLRGPRPLTGAAGQPILDVSAWGGKKL